MGGYLYACPIYATQTTYTEKCSNSKCGYIYRTWTEDGTKVINTAKSREMVLFFIIARYLSFVKFFVSSRI